MKILLIGSGAWPTKISSGLLSEFNSNEIILIGAREFLLQDSNLHNSFDLIWIMTTPQNQIMILNKISSYPNKLILEKPLFTTLLEEANFNLGLRKFQGIAQMSTVWLHSPLWKNSRVSLENIKSISIKHKYVEERMYCSPIFDWITHDLYLINDLGIKIHQSMELSTEYSAPGNMSVNFRNANNFSISVAFEKALQNDFSWEVQYYDFSRVEISFTNRSFKEINRGLIVRSFIDESRFNPAAAMIEYFLKTDKSNLQNLIDLHSHLISSLSFTIASEK